MWPGSSSWPISSSFEFQVLNGYLLSGWDARTIDDDARPDAPLERDLVDRTRRVPFRRWVVMARRIEMRPVVSACLDRLGRAPQTVAYLIFPHAEQSGQVREARPVVLVLDPGGRAMAARVSRRCSPR